MRCIVLRSFVKGEALRESIKKGIDFLWSIRSKDFGWGDHQNRPIDLSGCSESMFGMLRAGEDPHSELFRQSISYVRNELRKSPQESWTRGEQLKSARSLAWPILMLGELGEGHDTQLTQGLLRELDRFRCEGEGWSAEVGTPSNVFDSSLIIWALSRWRKEMTSMIDVPLKWMRESQGADGGWGFKRGDESNSICTSMCTLLLTDLEGTSESTKRALNWLTSYQQANPDEGVVLEPLQYARYDKWIHYSTPYEVLAFMNAGFSVGSIEVAGRVNKILKEQDSSGGWKILPDHPPFTHATAHALVALGAVGKILSMQA